MRSRLQGALAFATLLATCSAGLLHLSWWAGVAGACVLALISMSNHPIAARVGGGGGVSLSTLLLSSLLNAAMTSAAALAAGRIIGWVWGV
jgi:hypothetical protein